MKVLLKVILLVWAFTLFGCQSTETVSARHASSDLLLAAEEQSAEKFFGCMLSELMSESAVLQVSGTSGAPACAMRRLNVPSGFSSTALSMVTTRTNLAGALQNRFVASMYAVPRRHGRIAADFYVYSLRRIRI